ncbi:OmpA family protein [Oceaniglobus indicus]|uniref:OmpA family protein n=1 Tax=Oceaniglobus indicus TaxID=2047749 RepID=UPI000C19486E|nr:OmpA family protein [Oceaniglobus indicus]
MKVASHLPALAVFVLAAVVSFFSASFAVALIERTSVRDVTTAMRDKGYDWVTVSANGLNLGLAGTAPDEATRFRAITVANEIVDSARVIDGLEVAAAEQIRAPDFSIEILRNADGISLIGLIPADSDRDGLLRDVRAIDGAGEVADFLETADFPVPEGWSSAVTFAVRALDRMPRSKVSITPSLVSISAISDSRADKRMLETQLTRLAPDSLRVALDIAAPRPVITPFTLRFIIEEDGAHFDACSAATPEGRDQILTAAAAAGLEGKTDCTIGLGVPSPDWPNAAVAAIGALKTLGGGSVTLSDSDITLVGTDTTPKADFDTAVGRLEGSLPKGFSLFSVLPEKVVIDGTGEGDGPPEFIATKSPEGLVQLRGRIPGDRERAAIASFARARFGIENVQDGARTDKDLPQGWSPRILAALASLAELNNGAAVVQPDVVDIRGVTGNPDARAEIARILGEQLGTAEQFKLNVRYDKKLDPILGLPTPEECVSQINQVLDVRKITFAPGSAEIAADARDTVDRIAELLRTCDDVQMEIGGYTDSQGRETMNQQLSQSRAEAVLTALAAKRVKTANLTAIGFGEERPIATNETEEGREANRRIEFRLIVPEEPGTPDDEAESSDGPTDVTDQDDQGSGDGEIITGGAGSENEQN